MRIDMRDCKPGTIIFIKKANIIAIKSKVKKKKERESNKTQFNLVFNTRMISLDFEKLCSEKS
jgi:hypothetical protein